jgi:hypothetical protein
VCIVCRAGRPGEEEAGRGGGRGRLDRSAASCHLSLGLLLRCHDARPDVRPRSAFIAHHLTSPHAPGPGAAAGKRPRLVLADEEPSAGDDEPSTSGRDGAYVSASGGVLPHRQFRGQRVETPSYPGASRPPRRARGGVPLRRQPAAGPAASADSLLSSARVRVVVSARARLPAPRCCPTVRLLCNLLPAHAVAERGRGPWRARHAP